MGGAAEPKAKPMTEDIAATKIQAVYRGGRSRIEQKKKLAEATAETVKDNNDVVEHGLQTHQAKQAVPDALGSTGAGEPETKTMTQEEQKQKPAEATSETGNDQKAAVEQVSENQQVQDQ